MESFDQALAYEKNSSKLKEDGLNLISLLTLTKGNKILDLGCGTSYLTKVMADQVGEEGEVVGIDPDTERLQIAREKYPASNITYLEGSAEDIPGGNYDVVFSNYVLHWCKDKKLVFSNVAKSLKRGGKFGFVAQTDQNIEEVLFTPAEMFSQELHQAIVRTIHPVSTDEYLHHVASNDLTVTHISSKLQEWKYTNLAKVIEFYRTHWRNFGVEHFNTEAMEKHFGSENISIAVPRIVVVAQKNL